MDAKSIIETAAKRSGKLPIDDYDYAFGEAMIRSLNSAMDLVYGECEPGDEDFWEWIASLKTEAEAFPNE